MYKLIVFKRLKNLLLYITLYLHHKQNLQERDK